jgi:hypothetical protein
MTSACWEASAASILIDIVEMILIRFPFWCPDG